MGLTFHYSATARSREAITALIDETADIAQSLEWKYNIIDDENLYGITISAEGSEPLSLTFANNLKLCSVISLLTGEPGDPYYYTAFTKTQFAGEDTHIALLKLLKYVSDKYFSDIEVDDEGGYWGTWDKEILSKQFAAYRSALNEFEGLLSGMKAKDGETAESLVSRIEALLKKKNSGK